MVHVNNEQREPAAAPPGKLHRNFQLGEQRRVIEQAREAIAMHQLAQLTPALGARDHRLQQQRLVHRVRQEVVGAGAKGRDLVGNAAGGPDEDEWNQVEPRVLPQQLGEGDAVGVRQRLGEKHEVGHLCVEEILRLPRVARLHHPDTACMR